MTRVWLDTHSAVISGHAGAGQRGSDIVCAALSILMYTIREIPGAKALEADGFCRVDVPKEGRRELQAIARGFFLLEREYPQYVRVESGELRVEIVRSVEP